MLAVFHPRPSFALRGSTPICVERMAISAARVPEDDPRRLPRRHLERGGKGGTLFALACSRRHSGLRITPPPGNRYLLWRGTFATRSFGLVRQWPCCRFKAVLIATGGAPECAGDTGPRSGRLSHFQRDSVFESGRVRPPRLASIIGVDRSAAISLSSRHSQKRALSRFVRRHHRSG